jgi:hypothetical protein
MKKHRPTKATQARRSKEKAKQALSWQKMLAERVLAATGRRAGVLAED